MKLLTATFISFALVITSNNYVLAEQITGKHFVSEGSRNISLKGQKIIYLPCSSSYAACKNLTDRLEEGLSSIASKAISNIEEHMNSCNNYTSFTDKVYCIEELKQANKLDYLTYTTSIDKIENSLSTAESFHSASTDLEGNYSFDCPAKSCLIFSQTMVKKTKMHFTWIKMIYANQQYDLSDSESVKFPVFF
jgi:hypothetical protein